MTRIFSTTKARSPEDSLLQALSFALRYNGRKRVTQGDEFMARIAAERILEQLDQAGFVVMKKPGVGNHAMPPLIGERTQ